MPYTVARIISNITLKRLTDLAFWKSTAPCCQPWLQRDNHRAPIKDVLAALVRLE